MTAGGCAVAAASIYSTGPPGDLHPIKKVQPAAVLRSDFLTATKFGGEQIGDQTLTTSPAKVTQTASNDNPGGATRAKLRLSAFVTVLAKAYVAKTLEKDHHA